MTRKDKSQGRRDPLTPTEINRLSRMQPGESTTLRGMNIKCLESTPCQSGTNCQSCALYDILCDRVACMAGIHYADTTGEDLVRETDVYYAIFF